MRVRGRVLVVGAARVPFFLPCRAGMDGTPSRPLAARRNSDLYCASPRLGGGSLSHFGARRRRTRSPTLFFLSTFFILCRRCSRPARGPTGPSSLRKQNTKPRQAHAAPPFWCCLLGRARAAQPPSPKKEAVRRRQFARGLRWRGERVRADPPRHGFASLRRTHGPRRHGEKSHGPFTHVPIPFFLAASLLLLAHRYRGSGRRRQKKKKSDGHGAHAQKKIGDSTRPAGHASDKRKEEHQRP